MCVCVCVCRTDQGISDIQGIGIEIEESETGQDFSWDHGGASVYLINMSRVCRRGQNLKVRCSYKVELKAPVRYYNINIGRML